MAASNVWGIDIGNAALKAVRLGKDEAGKATVLSFDEVPYGSGTLLNQPEVSPEQRKELVRGAVQQLMARHDLIGQNIVIGVSGQQTFAKFTNLPPVDKDKIDGIVVYEASQQIPFPMEEVVWDYQAFAADDDPEVEVGIFAIRKEVVASTLSVFKEAGLEPTVIQLNPMAMYNAAKYDGWLAEDGKTVLIEIGTAYTDLVIADENSVWQRTMPIGSNKMTDAIVSNFKQSWDKAERLKRTAATSQHGKQIVAAMKPVFSDLLSEINKSVGFYLQSHRGAEIKRVVLVGNAFKFPGLAQFIKSQLQPEVVRFEKFRTIGGAPTATGQFQKSAAGMMVPMGMALQGLGLGKIEANLLPGEEARDLMWRRKKWWFIAAGIAFLAAAGILWIGSFLASSDYRSKAETEKERIAGIKRAAQERRQQVEAVATAGAETLQVMQKQLGLVDPQTTSMLAGLQNAIFRALPASNPAVRARDSEAYIAEVKQTDRQNRDIINLISVRIVYEDDFEGRGGGGNLFGSRNSRNQPEPRPGFRVAIIGETFGTIEDGQRRLAGDFAQGLRREIENAGLPLRLRDRPDALAYLNKRELQGNDGGIGLGGVNENQPGNVAGGGEDAPEFDPLFPVDREIIEDDLLFIYYLDVEIAPQNETDANNDDDDNDR